MAALLYTTTQAVRARLGVSDVDLSDQAMADFGLDTYLRVDLAQWLSGHADVYADGIAGGATAEQVLAKDRLVLYAQTFMALKLAESAQLWAFQQVSDGNIEGRRFANERLADLRDLLAGELADLKKELTQEEAPIATFAARVAPDYDPVVGADLV